MAEEASFIGVDVGTGSVRAARVSSQGTVLRTATHPISTWSPAPDFYEQSSDDIWHACCTVIKKVTADVSPDSVRGIGFDATCSLVTLDSVGQPVSVSPSGDPARNVVLWMDHRAKEEAAYINQMSHQVLNYVGGKISLEMQVPKLLWLKKQLRQQCWDKAHHFFDLPDFLTWKATNSTSRSLCSLVCKWTYLVDSNGIGGWSENFFTQIGLDDLKENNWSKIGSEVKMPGSAVGSGLSLEAAADTGLHPGTPVGTSLIDAHAGTLGLLGCSAPSITLDFTSRLGLICGTSLCHMAVAPKPLFVPGVWGPYYSAVVPGMWLSEGGQSATGRLLDHIIDTHPESVAVKEKLQGKGHIHDYLNDQLKQLAEEKGCSVAELTANIHLLADFHGNRSPLADPSMRGMICGLTLNVGQENLALLYLATIQAISYGTRHIASTLSRNGHKLSVAAACGGLVQNELFVQTLADVLQLPVLLPLESESMLLGSAILGACAASTFPSVEEAIRCMGGTATPIMPRSKDEKYHNKKYAVYLKMIEDQISYSKLMS